MSDAALPQDLAVPLFSRAFLAGEQRISRLGDGALGGKAASLVRSERRILSLLGPDEASSFSVSIPRAVVLTTELFSAFMDGGGLWDLALSDLPDDRIAMAFQQAELPALWVGDLRSLAREVHAPLAIRSSSLLEDALAHPFAGVYGTKMIPNVAPSADVRFARMAEAIKFIWASTFFRAPKAYARSICRDVRDERMAVLVQEIAGSRRGDRFYPTLSAVARSWNWYPAPPARPEEGVLSLALGLGKTIVDGGVSWTVSPAYPRRPMPFGSTSEMLSGTQNRFYAVHMGAPPPHDPIAEDEHLVQPDLADAEYDDSLAMLASTYDGRSDRLFPGTGRQGPRVLDFAPLLGSGGPPLVPLVRRLLALSEAEMGGPVEIEFAVDLDPRAKAPARLSFLQVRLMAALGEAVDVDFEALSAPGILLATDRALGNGVCCDIRDVVYVARDTFDRAATPAIAAEVEALNLALTAEGRPYMLIGFGRWGSSDPWLGIPVDWSRICGAKVVVEASLRDMNPDPSQGSHFFQNLIAFHVLYLTLGRSGTATLDWDWLERQPVTGGGRFVRHVRLESPLQVRADGRTARAVVLRHD